MKTLLSFSLAFLISLSLLAQSVAINNDGSAAHGSAMLEVKSANKGILIPRTSTLTRVSIAAPAKGLLVYDTTSNSFWYHNGTIWSEISQADGLSWRTIGNSGTNPATNFIGTTDNVPLTFRVNNQKAGKIDANFQNTFLGVNAGANTIGSYNSVLGFEALLNNTDGYDNTAMGYWALRNNTIGGSNTAIGMEALMSNISGNNNVAIGAAAFSLGNNTGSNNTALGSYALRMNVNGNFNNATGHGALELNISGNYNTSSGFFALRSNTLGSNNLAYGAEALRYSSTASRNIAFGNQALYTMNFNNNNTPWNGENIAIGDSSLFANQPTTTTNGYRNIAIGHNALHKNEDGYYNTAVGIMSMYSNSSGQNNVSLGPLTLYYNSTGSNNTVIGKEAGIGVSGSSFSNNTLVGYQSGYSLSTGSNNVFLGYQAGFTETSGSNKLYIANSNTANPLIGGDFSTGVVTINSLLTLTPSSAPASPVKGMIYFDNTINKLRCYDGTAWNNLW